MLNIGIAGLQETSLPSNSKLKGQGFTFLWQGRDPDELRQHAVGFAVRNVLLSSIEPPSGGTERILSRRFLSRSGSVHLLSIYTHTLYSSEETKDQFYKVLNCVIRNIPTNENIYLLGDFNARVGSDHDSWPICVGYFGIDNMNDNGQRLLGFCTYHNLYITNTFFANKPSHKASWRHPRSHHWHQLDLIITRRSFLNSVQLTCSYHSAVCDKDHSLIRSRVKILPPKVHHSKKMGRPRINTARTSDPTLQKCLDVSIKVALGSCPSSFAESRWNYIREALYTTSIDTFGMSERQNSDWFSAGL
ncbi:craniofacial development protein 2-like [Octopus bimaculoides]|uniref:craniofacial development protein 2-like n=1 Tax=Octopus bimaculoides TaxID=37653 RepID=UPI00071CE663|nr:craniofacial development protein 2-like [Octopus bimaculoides]|eukprot:XP_014779253.1 PREDICTED: craniofacial development protein 2-like [Octopus bimaculoides]